MAQLWFNFVMSIVCLVGAWFSIARASGSYVLACVLVGLFVVGLRLVHPWIVARRWAEVDARPFGVDGSVSDEEVA